MAKIVAVRGHAAERGDLTDELPGVAGMGLVLLQEFRNVAERDLSCFGTHSCKQIIRGVEFALRADFRLVVVSPELGQCAEPAFSFRLVAADHGVRQGWVDHNPQFAGENQEGRVAVVADADDEVSDVEAADAGLVAENAVER